MGRCRGKGRRLIDHSKLRQRTREGTWPGIALLICLGLLLCPSAVLQASNPPPVRALILYDADGPYPWIGELHAIQVANLLGHFPMAWEMKPVASYSAGEIENYAVTFYLGDSYGGSLPDSFLSDVRATERTVCWLCCSPL